MRVRRIQRRDRLKKKSIGRRLKEVLLLKPYRFQIKGVRFIEKHNGRVLLGDDMGIGKTLQAAGWAAIHPELRPWVIVCPATLKYAWQRELKKLLEFDSYICEGILLSPDEWKVKKRKLIQSLRKRSKKARVHSRTLTKRIRALVWKINVQRGTETALKQEIKKHEILIINYDILHSWVATLKNLKVQLLVVDESHYMANRSARRTKACRLTSKGVPHVIALSGTPITAGPIQFFSTLQMIRPKEFRSYWKYAFEYCAPTKNKWSGGWDFSGSSNLDTLHLRLKSIMIRRMKKDVLKNLPSKVRTVIPVDITNREEYDEAEENFLEWIELTKGRKAMDAAQRAEALVRLGQLLQLAAIGKLKAIHQWTVDFMNSTDEKLITFAKHKVIIAALRKKWPGSALVDGSVSLKQRDKEARRFFKDPKCRHFIGQIKAAGIGLNDLVVATYVLFAELGWTPAEHDQAEDRALRIGQTRQVNVIYMVGKDTVEERLLSIIEHKDKVTGRVLDGRRGGRMKLMDSFLKGLR